MAGLHVLPISRLPLGIRPLALGNWGEDVRELQRLLAGEGFYPGKPDGIFGVVTDEAVRQCEIANRLKVDGIAGPLVLEVLKNRAVESRPIYRVSGEPDLPAVARKLGLSVTALARANHLSAHTRTYPGQRLFVNRRVLGLWADGAGRPYAAALAGVSFMAYSAADLTETGHIERRFGRACDWVKAHSVQDWPVLLAGNGTWARILKRPEWWPGLWSEIHELAGDGRVILDVGSPGISQRRRFLRMLVRHVQPWRLNNGRVMLIFSLGARGRIPSEWLKRVAAGVDGVILQADGAMASADRLRTLLRPLCPMKASARFLLGASLTAKEEVLDEAGNPLDTLAVPYCEAQLRASSSGNSTESGPIQAVYRFKSHWRRLSFINAPIVASLCELVNSMGMEGIVLRGLEAADTRLYRLLPECFGVAEMAGGRP